MSSFDSSRAVVQVAIAVVLNEGHCLIGVRGPDSPLAGYDEFPGGKLDANETAPEAALRECREETGLQVQVQNELYRCHHDYPHARVELFFFRCTPVDTGRPTALPPFEWRPVSELGRLKFPEANAPVVALLLEQARG